MYIKTFDRELNPILLEKGRKLYLTSILDNNKVEKINDSTYSYTCSDGAKKYLATVKLLNNNLISETKCTCGNKSLICSHVVASLFAIKDLFIKEIEKSDESISLTQRINNYNSLNGFYYYLSLDLEDLKKHLLTRKDKIKYYTYFFEKITNSKDFPTIKKYIYSKLTDLEILTYFFYFSLLRKDDLDDFLDSHLLSLKNSSDFIDICEENYLLLTSNILVNHSFYKNDKFYTFLKGLSESKKYPENKMIFLNLNGILNNNFTPCYDCDYFNFLAGKDAPSLEKREKILLNLRFNLKKDEVFVRNTFIDPNFSFKSMINKFSLLEIYQSLDSFKPVKKLIFQYSDHLLEKLEKKYTIDPVYQTYLILKNLDLTITLFDNDLIPEEVLLLLIENENVANDLNLITDNNKYIYMCKDNGIIYTIYKNAFSFYINEYNYDLTPINSMSNKLSFSTPFAKAKYEKYLEELKPLISSFENKKNLAKIRDLANLMLTSEVEREVKYSLILELIPPYTKGVMSSKIKSRLKIKDQKAYYIPNIASFITSLKTKKQISLGKNAKFDLDILNFDKPSQSLLIDLMNSDLSGDKVVFISPSQLEKIFVNIKDVPIIINEKNFTYSSEPLKLNIKLEADTLTISNISKESLLIKCFIDDFVVDFVNLKISKLEYKNSNERKLIYFLFENSNFSIAGIKEEFNKEIYPLIYQNIEVDKKYLKENKLDKFEIESYLDYVDNKITLKTVYKLNKKEVSDVPITYQPLITKYSNLITSLKFEQNQISAPDDVFNFIKLDLSSLREISKVYVSESLKTKKVRRLSKSIINVRMDSNLLKVQFENNDFTSEELLKVINAHKKHKKYVLLQDDIIEFDEETAQSLENFIEEFNLDLNDLSKEIPNPLYKITSLNSYLQNNNFEATIEDKVTQILKDIKEYKNASFELSKDLKALLRPYQIEGFNWLMTLNKYGLGGILADDMGLGKTLQAICLLDASKKDYPSLIVSPKSLIFNWGKEIKKFPNSLNPIIYDGQKEARIGLLRNNKEPSDVFIVSYDTLRNDLDEFMKYKFNYVILDEAQAIKNIHTLKTRSTKKIDAINKLVLTGTPLENSLSDLWSIFDFLMSGYLYNYERFRNEIEKGVINQDDFSYKLIKAKTAPFILRRTKSDVLNDLPEKSEKIITLEMNNDQRKVYEAYLSDVKGLLDSKDKISVLAGILKLRQICISPKLLDDEGESEKINYCLQMVTSLVNNHKILVFSQFTKALNLIKDKLDESKIKYYYLDGKTKAKERIELCENFNNKDNEVKVFLISLKAGGVGLNLTGADSVIHLDPWWNVAIENQASDRAHRIGQKNPVTIFKLIMNNSIEEKVLDLQKIKKEIADKIINNDDSSISQMDIDDYKYLLS